ncbi:MAG: hypothetical protein ABIH89_03050, partial [Elusimicrobiota bacterium]
HITAELSGREILSHALWFDLYVDASLDDVITMNNYVSRKLAGYSPKSIRGVQAGVAEVQGYYLGELRKVDPSKAHGMVEVKEPKALEKKKSGMHKFVDMIRNLGRASAALPVLPTALALTAVEGNFDALAAYALGEQRAASLVELLEKLANQVEDLLGSRQDDSILDDLNSFRSMIEAT